MDAMSEQNGITVPNFEIGNRFHVIQRVRNPEASF